MFCRKCGKELKNNWNICPYCGETVGNRQDESETAGNINRDSGKRKLWIGAGAVAVVIVVVVVGAIFCKTGISTKKGQQTIKEG